MGESLTQRRRVREEALRGVNRCRGGQRDPKRVLMVPPEEGTANSVPAAAVIRRSQGLPGVTGRKGSVGGLVSLP
jgi:hypothetical protein